MVVDAKTNEFTRFKGKQWVEVMEMVLEATNVTGNPMPEPKLERDGHPHHPAPAALIMERFDELEPT